MNIALLGYGKMGKIIEEMAKERGHHISFKATSGNKDFNADELKGSDVAIEFSAPNAAIPNMHRCFMAGVPVVVGTTGWYDKFDKVNNCRKDQNGTLLYATNFSVGVNIFYEINRKLATLMSHQKQYNVQIEEIHHTEKLDAPSGTAISIAEGIIEQHQVYDDWQLKQGDVLPSAVKMLPIVAKRIPEVPGTHTVTYDSDIDTIEFKHQAKNRKGFALGAVLAAEFLKDKTGLFTMKDVLKLNEI